MLLIVTTLIAFILSLLARFAAEWWLVRSIEIIPNFAWLTPTENSGVAFGMQLPEAVEIPIIVAALIVLAVVAWKSATTVMTKIGFGLMLGGAFGNILDRIGDGRVTDFFHVDVFPVFNAADACISIGVGCLMFDWIFPAKGRRGDLS